MNDVPEGGRPDSNSPVKPADGPMSTEPKADVNPRVEQVPDWLRTRLRDLYTEVTEEPLPDELLTLVKRLEEHEPDDAEQTTKLGEE